MNNSERYAQCFRDALGLEKSADVTALSYQKNPAWDSVAHMRLIAAIESQFKITFTTDEILGLDSFARGREMMATHAINLDS